MDDIKPKHLGCKEMTKIAHGSYNNTAMMANQAASKFFTSPASFNNPFNTNVYKHPDKLGAGAEKRKHLAGKDKIHAVMGEFKRGTLHSGSGEKVKSRKQAIAIAMSEAHKSKK